MNITKHKGIVMTLGVVVCFFNFDLFSKDPLVVNPTSLHVAKLLPTHDNAVELDLEAELDALDEKIELLEGSVAGHKETMEAGRQELEKIKKELEAISLAQRYTDDRVAKKAKYLEKADQITAAINAIREDLKALKNKKISVNNDINIVVGGSPAATKSIFSMTWLSANLWDFVKTAGMSAGAYYLVNKVLSALAELQREQREFYEKIIKALLEQQEKNGKPSVKIPDFEPGFSYDSWSSVLSTAAAVVPVCWTLIQWYWTKELPPIFSIQETSKEAPSVVDAGIKAWRIIGGERIPVR